MIAVLNVQIHTVLGYIYSELMSDTEESVIHTKSVEMFYVKPLC